MSRRSVLAKKFPDFDPMSRLKAIVESGVLEPRDEAMILLKMSAYWYPTLKAQEITAAVKKIQIEGNGMEFKT